MKQQLLEEEVSLKTSKVVTYFSADQLSALVQLYNHLHNHQHFITTHKLLRFTYHTDASKGIRLNNYVGTLISLMARIFKLLEWRSESKGSDYR